jgi:phage terminase small subunit
LQKTVSRKHLTGTKKSLRNTPCPETATTFPPPDWLKSYTHGLDLWEALSPQLLEIGILFEIDTPTFATMCVNLHLMRISGDDLLKKRSNSNGRSSNKEKPGLNIV